MDMNPNPNSGKDTLSFGSAKRFPYKEEYKWLGVRIYAQDADGLKYVFSNIHAAAAACLQAGYSTGHRKDRQDSPAERIAREIWRAVQGNARNKDKKHRYLGFDWYVL